MKLKTIVIFSVVALLLIVLVQHVYIGYAMGELRAKTETTLDACFKKAFDRTVDDEVNSLPLPEGTLTHLIYMPVRPGETLEEEAFSFYTSQQTSAILQDVYGKPLPLDTLLLNLERELRGDGVEGRVELRVFDARTDTTLQRLPARSGKSPAGMEVVSGKAYLNEAQGLAVEGKVFFPLREGSSGHLFGFSLATRLLAALVVVAFFLCVRHLRRQQESIARQQSEFYQRAKELEAPVRQVEADILSARWKPVHEAGKAWLSSVETTLTHAKQANARLHRRRFLPWMGSGLAIAGIFLLTVLWSVYFYMERRREVAWQAQIAFEEAFMKESRERYDALHQRLSAEGKPTSRLTGASDYAGVQLDSLLRHYWLEPDSLGNPQGPHIHTGYAYVKPGGLFMNENARVRRAYTNQYYFEAMDEPYLPLDSFRMDSLFNSLLHGGGLPGGQLHFFRRDADSLSSRRGDIVTLPVSIRNDRTEWMQGVVPVSFLYVWRADWHFFLPLLLTFLFTLFCVYIQWRIARRQRTLEQFRRDFTYAMIHDMKSPLQSVLMGSQIMASGKLDAGSGKAVRIVSAMQDECEHLLALSHRVVTLTQIERGELQLHKTEILLRPLLDDLAAKFHLKAPKPVSFEVDCADGFSVTADAFCLREVLSNLIDNAVKYSRESVHIRLSAVRSESSVCLSVRDNGIGISRRDSQRIFGRFERVASGSSATGVSGFGLGLNFVWQVVQAHGGTVSVQSDGRSYSEFRVTLPGKA